MENESRIEVIDLRDIIMALRAYVTPSGTRSLVSSDCSWVLQPDDVNGTRWSAYHCTSETEAYAIVRGVSLNEAILELGQAADVEQVEIYDMLSEAS